MLKIKGFEKKEGEIGGKVQKRCIRLSLQKNYKKLQKMKAREWAKMRKHPINTGFPEYFHCPKKILKKG